ncbi:MAG: ParB/RepB/Spo0J family partition protein [Candidatus Parcubacteria bacterium]|nr:ParB/RepB/Spo0J family partition protein [Candidatus Parcubacteria bacterium]
MTQENINDDAKPKIYDSIFWIEVEKIKPNPYQPRREFDESRLRELADSIRQYGVLQPLVVTRKEFEKEEGGMGVEYELISGERRLRASKLAGVKQVPTVIRTGEDDNRVKLELAIIENLQREDLNPVDRARAFGQLASEFGLKHTDIGKRVGRSREYVSNTIRLLALPQDILDAIAVGKISEGHSRPILMLADRPEEQLVLFKEILYKKLTVRETEGIARRIAYDRVRKKSLFQDPEIADLETKFTERLGTRVRIEKKDDGGKMVIDFFSNDDLRGILELMQQTKARSGTELMDKFIENQKNAPPKEPVVHVQVTVEEAVSDLQKERDDKELAKAEALAMKIAEESAEEEKLAMNDKSPEELRKEEEEEEDLYSIGNFSI